MTRGGGNITGFEGPNTAMLDTTHRGALFAGILSRILTTLVAEFSGSTSPEDNASALREVCDTARALRL
jgi:predicted alpha-1,6-mannanase (GH76 family)